MRSGTGTRISSAKSTGSFWVGSRPLNGGILSLAGNRVIRQYDREYVHKDLLPFLFTADCEPRGLTETPVAGDESWHIETVAKRDANKKALEQVEKATDSEPVKGKELLEPDELKRKLSEAEERFRSGLSPKKAKSESR
jgi:hypothetical protein